jgi:hypothetical protein
MIHSHYTFQAVQILKSVKMLQLHARALTEELNSICLRYLGGTEKELSLRGVEITTQMSSEHFHENQQGLVCEARRGRFLRDSRAGDGLNRI